MTVGFLAYKDMMQLFWAAFDGGTSDMLILWRNKQIVANIVQVDEIINNNIFDFQKYINCRQWKSDQSPCEPQCVSARRAK